MAIRVVTQLLVVIWSLSADERGRRHAVHLLKPFGGAASSSDDPMRRLRAFSQGQGPPHLVVRCFVPEGTGPEQADQRPEIFQFCQLGGDLAIPSAPRRLTPLVAVASATSEYA